MQSERLQILNMIQDGKITADEGAKLLEALETNSQIAIKDSNKAKWLKVKVLDPEDNNKVNIILPLSLVSLGIKFATKFSPEFKEIGLREEDMEEIFRAIKNEESGKIMDVDGGNGEKVEIIIE